jgi:hypothetical protein
MSMLQLQDYLPAWVVLTLLVSQRRVSPTESATRENVVFIQLVAAARTRNVRMVLRSGTLENSYGCCSLHVSTQPQPLCWTGRAVLT